MGKNIILERLGTILTPIKHLLDKLEANKVDKSELNEILEPKVDRGELNNALRPKVDREELNEILEPKVNRDELYDALEIKVDKQELDVAISNVVSSIPDVNDKMNIDDPVGLGSFSMNRRSGSSIGLYSTTLGYNNVASGRSSLAEGNASIAKGKGAHAEGDSSTAASDYSHAEGRSITFGLYSHAEGYETHATMRSQHVHGEFNELDPLTATGKSNNQNRGKYIHIIGNGKSPDQRSNAHTLDWDGLAWFARGIKVGGTGQDDPSAQKVALKGDHLSDFTNDLGYITTEEISSTYATKDEVKQEIRDLVGTAPETLDTLEELATALQENEDIVETLNGAITDKMDKNSPKGTGTFSLNRAGSIGENSVSVGTSSVASGRSSIGAGYSVEAIGDYSHAEGRTTMAYGNASHAEGNQTIAYKSYSHAEGSGTNSYPITISGAANSVTYTVEKNIERIDVGYVLIYGNKVAQIISIKGNRITLSQTLSNAAITSKTVSYRGGAIGSYSHSEGLRTYAIGDGSHTEGIDTVAASSQQHVQGRYNISDKEEEYAHIVGNGASNRRSNAHTLDWDGNAWFSGDVYVDSTSGTNKDEGSKKLATEDYVNSPKSQLILTDQKTGENYIVCIENGNLVSYKAE